MQKVCFCKGVLMLEVCFLMTRCVNVKGVFLPRCVFFLKVCCVTHLPFSEGVLTKGVQVG